MAKNNKKQTGGAADKTNAAPKAKAPARQAAAKEGGIGGPAQWYEVSAQFLREVKAELKKVTWPTREQTIRSTGVVVVLVVIISAYLGLVDLLLSHVVGYLIPG